MYSTREEILTGRWAKERKWSRLWRNSTLGGVLSRRRAKKQNWILTPVPGKDLTFERPSSLQDLQRYLNFSMRECDRNFWFNLVVGSRGPNTVANATVPSRGFRSRDTAKLEFALADVQRLHDFSNGRPILFYEIVFPPGGRPVAGTFAETLFLKEPNFTDLDNAFSDMTSFFAKNQDDPEWDGGQLNLFFAGHGLESAHERAFNRGGLVLKDETFRSQDFHERLMKALPESTFEKWDVKTYGNCRVDMFLDCCYSGQFAAALLARLLEERKGLVPGKIWCSCMPFQQSFESDRLRHGVFTAYFLNDESSNKPTTIEAAEMSLSPSLKSGDVTSHTEGRQSPWMIDFTVQEPEQLFSMTIPGARGTKATLKALPLRSVSGESFSDWLTEFLHLVHEGNRGSNSFQPQTSR